MSEGLRILIIEGNPADAGFIHEMLPQAGPLHFQVESVRKLSEALTRLEQKDIDLVLLNLLLPDSQGLQTFHTLQKAAPEVPVIVLAGNDDHELAITAVQDGAQDYLVKGQVSVRPLIRAVRYALARQKAAAAVRQSELKFRTLVETIPQKIFIKGGDYHYLSVNENYARDLHLKPEEAVGKTDYDFYPRELADKYRADDRRIMRKGQTEYFDEKYIQDGREVWVHTAKTPVRDETGKITGVLGIFWDITERKIAEEAVRQSREEFRELFDNAPVGFHEIDAEGRIVRINNTELKMLGYSAEELLGQFVWKISADEELSRRASLAKLAGEMLPPPEGFERMFRRKDGSTFPVWINDLVLKRDDGVIIGTRAAIQDISEKKNVEAELNRERDLWRMLLDTSPDKIYFKDAQSRFIKCSKSQALQFGKETPDEMVGKTDFDVFDESHARPAFEDEQEIIRTGRPMIDKEEREDYKDGHISWVASTKMPMRDASGKIVGIMGVSRDVTGRKQVEAELNRERDLWRTLLDNSPDKIYFKDAQSRFVKCSKALAIQFGMDTPEELVGKTDFDFFDESHARPAFEDEQEIIRTGRPMIDKEEREEWRDGRVTWVSSTKVPWLDGTGEIIGIMGISRDITGRKQAEEAVRESERRFQTLAVISPVGIFRTDAQGQTTYVNPTWCEIAGLPATDALGVGWLRAVHPDDREKLAQGWQAAAQARSTSKADYRFVHPDGTISWVMGQAIPEKDDSGHIVGYVGTITDITGRKQAEAALRDSEAFLNTVIEKIPHMIFVKDAKELRFVKFNEAGQKLLGYSLEELAGKNDHDLFPKEQADYFTEKDRDVLRGREVVDIPEEPVQTRAKEERILHTKKIPIFDNSGSLTYLLGISEDITEHKRAEQKLAEALHFNQKIISAAPVGIVVFKASGRCVLANEIAARTLNATVTQLLEQDFRQIVSWRTSGMLRLAEEALATKEPRYCESDFNSTFGKEVSLVCHFSPFVQNGEPHLLLVFNDVTEKKKLEAQFLRAQRMESIGTLAGGIAHDLNNVLAPLLISVQLLRDKVSDADGRKLIATLEANINRGADLVKQVLTFGRGIKGERVMIQIKHIAREIKGIIQETFPKSIRLQLEVAPDLWKNSGDATQIEQVMLNLCVNARDAMPGGGNLSIRLENMVLDEAYVTANLEARSGRYVVINVTDTGVGMTREVQDRIFEPFFTTKEHGKGTGLGLSTTLVIVKSHGGFIHCYSEPGKGSAFKVYLPVGDSPHVETATAEKPGLLRGHNEMVLVVDDEEPIRNIVKQILERFGYRVLLAADGAEAVRLYASHRNEIAVVITDMAMPVMDGPAAIAALKGINPDVKIIGSSGFDAGNKAGAAIPHFIAKPYTAEALLNMLHNVLRNGSAK